MDVVVCVGVSGLQRENGCVRGSIQLNDSLHWQWPIDEIRRLVVHILHMNDHALIVRI